MDPNRCAASVYPRGGPYRAGGFPCANQASVLEGGEFWCRVHAPSAVRAREEKSRARYAEEKRRSDHAYALRKARQEVVEAARAWSKAARDTVIGSSPSKLGSYAGAVHDAVDRLERIKKETP